MKKIKGILFAMIICVCFAGCGTGFSMKKYSIDNPEGRTVITLEDYQYNSYLDMEVSAFNERNPRYFVELESYENMDREDYYKRREVKLLSGEGADLYNLTNDYRIKTYIDKGVLERLDPFIETTINKKDYIDFIFDSYRCNNATYAIPTSFYMHILTGRKDMFPLYPQVTFDNLYKITMENENIENVISLSDEAVLWEFYDNFGMDIYDSDQLRKGIEVLDECRKRRENHKKSLRPNQPLIVNLGENTELVYHGIWNVQNVLNDVSLYDPYVEDYYVPINETYIVSTGSTLGINHASKHQEGAWEFIKFVLSKERQKEIGDSDYFKVYKSSFLEDISQQCKRLEGLHDMTKEEMEQAFLEVFENYTKISKGRFLCNRDYNAWLIVEEEVTAYFNGDKSIEETLGMIEMKLKQYQIK